MNEEWKGIEGMEGKILRMRTKNEYEEMDDNEEKKIKGWKEKTENEGMMDEETKENEDEKKNI